MLMPKYTVFVKPAVPRLCKVLYLMGSTWHTKCMFDIDTVEDSCADLLQKNGVESYTFNIVGTGPLRKPNIIGDGHLENVLFAKNIIEEHGIDYIMAYSYGSVVACELVTQFNVKVKGVFLIDPFGGPDFAPTYIDTTDYIEDGDKRVVTRQGIQAILDEWDSTMKDDIKFDYFNSLGNGSSSLVTAAYPYQTVFKKHKEILNDLYVNELKKRCKLQVVFSKTAREDVKAIFPGSKCYTDATHWIMLEDRRFDLINDFVNFVKE